MWHPRHSPAAVAAGLGLLLMSPFGAAARDGDRSLCSALIQEEMLQLDEFELDVDIARAEFDARVRIFEMIDRLWEKQLIERMVYLESRYNRDSTHLQFEAADSVAVRQRALIARLRLACGLKESGPLPAAESDPGRAAARTYGKAQCDSLSKRLEAARIDQEFDRQFLANIRELRAGNVATQTDLILAELDVEKDDIRIDDATRRLEACRREDGPQRQDQQ